MVMVVLIALAIASDLHGWGLTWLLVALIAGLIGDILLLPSIDQFVAGLGAFLIGHVAYALLAIVLGTSTGYLAIGLVTASIAVLTAGTKITDSVQGTSMFAPVVSYVVVIGASTALLISTGRPAIIAGALLFAVSDTLLGWGRFVAPAIGGRVAVHVTYHLGQLLIVIGAASGISALGG